MQLFPAIDLLNGEVVRLTKGDYNAKQVYSSSPIEVAKSFEAMGAKFLHLVDLDGASKGMPVNIESIKGIVKNTDLFVEVGGGIRNMSSLDNYLGLGVQRAILGTAAIRDKSFLKNAVSEYGSRIAVGLDALKGYVAVDGWLTVTSVTIEAFLAELIDLGVQTVIVTDISKDGAMQGTNIELYKRLNRIEGINVTASGGVSSIEELKLLESINTYAVIMGKAIYNGAIDLRQAIKLCGGDYAG